MFPIEVPPLRERREDIVPLAAHFLEHARREFRREGLSLTKRHAELLNAHDWPGNIRELRNVIEQAVILSQHDQLRLDLVMPEGTVPEIGELPARQASVASFLTEAECQHSYRDNLVAALEAAQWQIGGKGGAADLLGINPSTLRDRMKSLAIKKPSKRVDAQFAGS